MKVRDLIAGATFTPGAGRSGPAPRVTVILPTFRRGDDGLLRRALDSLLGQSFDDLEVIVVDDASTDSTAAVIDEIMKRDPRVSVIRHARNIGLPAVSEYEAYIQARGELIAFAFDDTVFYRHGIRRLVLEADRHPGTLVSASVNAFYRDPEGRVHSVVFGRNTTESDLLAINHMPNNGILAPKSVLDEVGLYDPHISLARICDYDLWLRAHRRVPVSYVEMCVGEEHGPAHSDSLGSTYVLDHWAADDRIRQARNDMLRPENFADVDVFDLDGFASERSREVVTGLAAGHLRTHEWMSPPVATTPSLRVPRIMVVSSPIDATVQLVFEGLRDDPGIHVRMVDPRWRFLGEVAPADVLILARRVRDDWAQVARIIGIPAYYYLDDNLPLMAEAGELSGDDRREFALETLRAAVAHLDGVLTSTEALADSFREQGLHRSVDVLPLSIPSVMSRLPARPPVAADGPATFALFVGPHRLGSFRRILWPAFVEAARRADRRIRILVPDASLPTLRRLHDDRVSIEGFPSHLDYFSAVRDLRAAGTDALVVPAAKGVNSRFKTLHPMVTAAILDAAVLLPEEEPYLGLAGEDRVALVGARASSDSWTEAIVATLDVIPSSGHPRRSLDPYAPAVGAARLREAVGARIAPTAPDIPRRVLQVSDWLAHQLAVARSMNYGSQPVALQARRPDPGLAGRLHEVVRRSRRVNAFRRSATPLSSFDGETRIAGVAVPRRGERTELSTPLGDVGYIAYRMALPTGRHRRIRALIWAQGLPGEVAGVEIVDPDGRIVLHTVTALPGDGAAAEISFDARKLTVPDSRTYEVRVFARTAGAAHLLEIVDRRPLGLRRPRIRPVLGFDLD